MHVVIFADGENKAINTWSSIISKADYIIAADGGIFNCLENNIQADCIIGDLDSLKANSLEQKISAHVIHIEEQNSTDMEKALKHARTLNPTTIDIFCAFGKRTDHSLGNIIILNNNSDLDIYMHDAYGTMFALDPGLKEFSDLKGTTVSLFALSAIENITLSGFEFPLQQQHIVPPFPGVSNKIAAKHASIKFEKGRLLVYQMRDVGENNA